MRCVLGSIWCCWTRESNGTVFIHTVFLCNLCYIFICIVESNVCHLSKWFIRLNEWASSGCINTRICPSDKTSNILRKNNWMILRSHAIQSNELHYRLSCACVLLAAAKFQPWFWFIYFLLAIVYYYSQNAEKQTNRAVLWRWQLYYHIDFREVCLNQNSRDETFEQNRACYCEPNQ